MAVFTLTLIRHGETNSNKEKIIQGHRDTKLSEKGKRQAELIGQRLQNEKFSHVYSSDLLRAFETCENIIKQNRANSASIVQDKRLRERKYGIFEGRPAAEFRASARRELCDYIKYVPPGAESLEEVNKRACDFFEELCTQLRTLMEQSGMDALFTGKRKRNTSSLGSDVFPYPEQSPELLTADTLKENSGHASSGSTSSGCSSIATESESPSEQSCDPSSEQSCEPSCDTDSGGPLSPELPTSDISPSKDSSSSSQSEEDDHLLCPMVDSDILLGITPPRGMQYGCPNVSLSPIFEHRLSTISSISSGRNSSFDDGDIVPGPLAEVLVVTHGGTLKQLLSYFVDELGCKIPGGKKNALQVSPNTGLSKFTITLGTAEERPKVTCLSIHDKDHLIDEEVQALEKGEEA